MGFWVLRSIVWVLLHAIFAAMGSFRVEGRHNVPKEGAALIVPNHFSDADPPTVGLALPRACYFMAKEELFALPFWGKMIQALRGFPVKRYTADRAALRFAENLLKQGEAVVIFPEGKLSESGKLQPFLPGVLLIAHRSGAPIVPTALIGLNKMMPYGEIKPRYTGETMTVRFGAPVSAEYLMGGLKGGEGYQRGAERLRLLVQALLDGEAYPYLEPLIAPENPAPPANNAPQANA